MRGAGGPPPARVAWGVWGLGAALYLIGFYQRVAPAVMVEELRSDLGLGAAALGNLSAFYFYSYVAMQVPTGILADRWGPRRLLTAGAFAAALGTLVFALAPGAAWAGIGRLLVGGSVAVAFVGMLKLATHWFEPRQFALASGMALLCGIVGAVTAGVPLRALVSAFGWRPVMVASAALTLVVAVAIWVLVRDDPSEKGYASYAPGLRGAGRAPAILAGLAEVVRYRNTGLVFLSSGGLTGAVLAFGGLWGVPYLVAEYGLTRAGAAAVTSALMVAFGLGGPVLGALSDRIGRRKPLHVAGCAVAAVGWSGVIWVPGLPLPAVVALLLATGFATGAIIIGFAYAKESVPGSLGGTVSGVCNMGTMMGPMVLQPAVGLVLDRLGEGAGAYRTSLGLVVAAAWVALAFALFTRETYCRPWDATAGGSKRRT
ncbi:MAG: MFS transporter [Deferrisomatales bacterium]